MLKIKFCYYVLVLVCSLSVLTIYHRLYNQVKYNYKPRTTFLPHDKRLVKAKRNFDYQEWQHFMPEIATFLIKANPDAIDTTRSIKNSTDPMHVLVWCQSTSFVQGEQVFGQIQAKDYYGVDKAYGGDYFRAKLVRLDENAKKTSDSVAVIITDHANGTYTWRTILPWSGQSELDLELVHPSEAVLDLILKTNTTVPHSIAFEGIYPSGARVGCNVNIGSSPTETCDFSNLNAGSTWQCHRPNNETCPKELAWSKRIGRQSKFPERKELYDKTVNRDVLIENHSVIKSVESKSLSFVDNVQCGQVEMAKSSLPSGYLHDGVWKTSCGGNTQYNKTRANICLRNKPLYLIGDSTSRQWYKFLVNSMELNDTGPNNSIAWSHSRTGRNKEHNVTVYYRAHGIPLHNPGPPSSRPFIVDTLDSITDLEVTVVFNLGAHFALYHPSVFIQRVAAIKKALIRLKQRSQTVKVFLRLGVRFKRPSTFLPSEWYLYRFNRIMLGMFSDLKFLQYIDTWEITTAQTPDDVHAKKEFIRIYLGVLLSRIC